jgi:hypothetical protein
VHRVAAGQRQRHQGVAHLMVGDGLALVLVQHAVLLFQAGDDAFHRAAEVVERDGIGTAAGGQQRRLVDQVGDVGAGKAGGQRRHLLQIDLGSEFDLLHMDLEDVDAAFLVGAVDQHLAVEAAGAQQRRVEDFRAVGGGEDDQPDRGVEAVHLGQQLVEGLLALVVAAHRGEGAACASQRVEFVDEDDGRRLLARLLEQVAHPRRADADEHLDEFGSGDGKERHPGLARDRLGEQRLAGPRRTDQQHALGDVGAEAAVVLRVLEEVDDLVQSSLDSSTPATSSKVTPVSVCT